MSAGRIGLVLLAGLAVAGCSNRKEGGSLLSGLRQGAAAMLSAPAPARLVGPTLRRASIEASKKPFIYVAIPAGKKDAILGVAGRNGAVTTYATADGSTVSLRDGILVATRGLGHDLMSARMPSLARLRMARGPVTVELYHLGLNDQTRAQRYSCDLADHGADPVTVVQKRYATRRVTLTCAGGDGPGFVNDYWIDSKGVIWKSHQWVSPLPGYLDIALLRR